MSTNELTANGKIPGWWHRLWAANPYLVDGIIASFLAITSIISLFAGTHFDRSNHDWTDPNALAVILLLVGIGSLTFRRRWPLPVLGVVSVCSYLYFGIDFFNTNLDTAMAIAAWTVVTRMPRGLTIATNAAAPMVLIAVLVGGPNMGRAVSNVFFVAIVSVIGHNVRLRKEKRVQEERVEVLEADTAVADERLRIARELHDVVAHAMSVVAVQAGVAAHVIDTQPEEAKRMLENVRATSHDALDEMRRLLGVLRGGDADLMPAPGLRDVDDLAESLRASGVSVDVQVTGDPTGVPAGVDLTAYRIVQEALTNVLKHAGPAATARVTIDYSPVLVVVEVTDDGRGAGVLVEGGHGLLGMRERVAVFGGDLVAGAKPGGGFRVRATLPYGR